MEYYLPDAVEAGRYRAQKSSLQTARNVALHFDDHVIPIAEFHDTGFSIDKKYNLPNRANIEIYDGAALLYNGIIHYAHVEERFQHFEFKRLTPHTVQAPKDYADANSTIAGLLSSR